MTAQAASAVARRTAYLKFAGLAIAIVALVAAIGWKPTEQLAGGEGVKAMLVGCGLSLLASLLGALPVAFGDPSPTMATTWTLAATAIRLAVAVLGAVVVLLSGRFAAAPLLLWVALSHGALLVVDARFALQINRGPKAERE